MKTAMTILIGAILLVVALSLLLVYANTHPPKYPLYVPPSTYKAGYEDVVFTSEDGVKLSGWIVKPPRPQPPSPAVIICHGVGANKSDFTEFAVALSRRGYAVLLFDFRAHGESGGSRTSLGYHEQKDVLAALGYLKTRREIDPHRIGIYGFSLGGTTAILAAATSRGFRAVVADSAFTSLKDMARTAITGVYHLPKFPFVPLTVLGYELYFQTSIDRVSPVTAIAGIFPSPVLLIAGEGDNLIPADNGRRLYAAAKEPKELWIIPGAEHGGTLASAENEYEKRVGEFFDKNLKNVEARRGGIGETE
jgi:dipeptidyl aminopeptidase/acylaminoacyl peptidase